MSTPRKPIAMLSDQQLAKLFVHLEVPVAVQSLLNNPRKLDDEGGLALHDMISGQTPDQALISIALSSLLLDAHLRENGHRCAEILAMSAEMMLQDFAPLYLEHTATHPKGTLFDRHDLEFLSTIPEDLENISDLLSVVADVLPGHCATFAKLANILSVQAQAQALVAETLVEAFGEMAPEELALLASLQNEKTYADTTASAQTADNIIPFRRR